MKHFISIDQVCAWPRLLNLEGGEILAVLFDQPTPALWAGGLACWLSTDNGATWLKQGLLTPDRRDVTFVNVAVGRTDSGIIQAMYAGFDQRPPPGQASPINEDTALPTVFTHSADGGKSWASPLPLPPPFSGCHEFTPYGKIVSIGENRSGTILYGYQNKTRPSAYFYIANADGQWQPVGIVNVKGPGIDETQLLWLGGTDLLAFGRSYPDRRIVCYSSNDNGRNWSYQDSVTGAGESPASLCVMPDGRIVLTYAYRHVNRRGIAARYSSDHGQTWSSALFLADYGANAHGGHPSTVSLGDGRLLTAYFAEYSTHHHRYHMAAIQWKLADFS